MRPTRLFAPALAALVLFAPGCGPKKGASGGPPPAPVRIGEVTTKSLPVELAAIGHVEAFSTVSVKPRVGGEVTNVGFREGEEVAAGALLFQIDSRPYEAALAEARANLSRDRARLTEAERTLARYDELIKKEYITQEQYDQARANVEALKATTQGDEAGVENARLNLEYARITAPVPGRTGSLLVHKGNVVKANDDRPLVVINQIEPIYVSFAIPERDFLEVKRRAAERTLSVTATPQAGKPEEGTLTFLDNAVDPTTGTITLKASFPNRDRALWPGQYVNASLALGVDENAVVAPVEALQTGQSGTYVWVVKGDSSVESRTVVVRRRAAGWALVTSGLAPGEKVVTDGQIRLAPGTKVVEKKDAAPAPPPKGTEAAK
jgi:membrane fusion protein, multidrug efflux system